MLNWLIRDTKLELMLHQFLVMIHCGLGVGALFREEVSFYERFISQSISDTRNCFETYLLFGWKAEPRTDQKPMSSLIVRFMGPTWGSPGADRTQVGPMLAPWTLLSGIIHIQLVGLSKTQNHPVAQDFHMCQWSWCGTKIYNVQLMNPFVCGHLLHSWHNHLDHRWEQLRHFCAIKYRARQCNNIPEYSAVFRAWSRYIEVQWNYVTLRCDRVKQEAHIPSSPTVIINKKQHTLNAMNQSWPQFRQSVVDANTTFIIIHLSTCKYDLWNTTMWQCKIWERAIILKIHPVWQHRYSVSAPLSRVSHRWSRRYQGQAYRAWMSNLITHDLP